MVQRPLSPASESSAGDYSAFSLGGAGASRVCRALFVEAEAHETGVRSTVYCRIALPASTNAPAPLLALPPLSHLLHHSTYTLPLGPESLSSSSTECLRAARLLGLTDATSVGGASSRRDTLLANGAGASPAGRRHNRTIKLVQQDKKLSLVLEGTDSATHSRTVSPNSFTSRLATPSPTGAPSSRYGKDPSGRKDQADRLKEEKLEWILVMRLESSFGGLHEPRFANSVTIPLPPCLRNSLAFTLPTSSASTSSAPRPQWDLAVKPSLRSSSSSTPPGDSTGPTTITGRFTSTSALSIRWTPRNSYTVVVPQSQLDVAWGIGENGWGRVTVKGEAELDYAGLKDKAWVELQVDHGAGSLMDNSTRAFEILSLEGEGVLAWEVVRETPRQPEPLRHPRLAREPSSEYTTPTPRPRPTATHLKESRPPSFTNLFDTTAPEAPELDPAVVAKMREPSLLRQAAPFEGDSSMDMTFEMSSSDEEGEGISEQVARLAREEKDPTSSTSSPEAPEADSDVPQAEPTHFSTTTTIRLQLSLGSLLRADTLPSPSFSFELKADFPAITLRSLSNAFYPPIDPQSFRLALPTFSLPAAAHEQSVVSVSAGAGGSVELLASDPMMRSAGASDETDSPLPATGGRARWRTERSQDDGSHRRSRSSSDLVEVEVSLPASRPTSLIQLDELADSDESPSPSPAARSATNARHLLNRPSVQSLRSKSSTLSLGLNLASTSFGLQAHRQSATLGVVKLRITPVPPSGADADKPWRLFTHLTFPRSFIGGFELPLKEGQNVVVCDCWNERGEQAEVESELLDGATRRMRIETGASRRGSPVVGRMGEVVALEEEMEGVSEMLYCVSTPGQEGKVEVGDVLPRMEIKMSSMEVEVLPVAGYELLTDQQAFDSFTPSRDTQSTRFTRFQISASEPSCLSVFLQPAPPPSLPPSPVVERTSPPRAPPPQELSPASPSPPPVSSPLSPPSPPSPPSPNPPVPAAAVEPEPAIAPHEHEPTPVTEEEMEQASLKVEQEARIEVEAEVDVEVEAEVQVEVQDEIKPEPAAIAEVGTPISASSPSSPSPPAIAFPTLEPVEVAQKPPSPVKVPQAATITPPLPPSTRTIFSSILTLSPFFIFLIALAVAHFAAPDGISSLNPLHELLGDSSGAWPSFNAEGELVLVQKETATPSETTTSSSSIISLSTNILTTTKTVTTTASSSAIASSTPLPSSPPILRIPPSSTLPAAPRPTSIDELPPPPPPQPAEADQQAGLEPAGFPSVLAEIVQSWRMFESEVKGWVGWMLGWVGI